MATFDIKKLLQSVITHGASDLHLVSRSEPQIRLDGKLKPVNLPKLTGEDIEEMCYSLITEKQKRYFEEYNELDFALLLPGIGRFRANYYRTLNDIAAAFRIIPIEVPSLDDLGAPTVFKQLIKREKGLILVTGPTGSGKSTTLAALLNEINLYEQKHIITVEDPVEFIHENKKAVFSHREVGEDTNSFATALKYAMRQDPDIILIGEMRDKETIEAALTAAETGHLVFGTLHTSSAPGTINRIIDVFSGDEQPQIRAMISSSLVAVIAQSLLPKLGGGRIAAHEIMVTNHAISNLIREDKIHQLYSQMQLGQEDTGMQTQTQALLKCIKSGKIERNVALQYANKPEEIAKAISY
ncbi:MAG: type IV pilus twitching motility protein PilT [Sulfurovum sp.]|nr:type IV pilus twitching motility protein PilT [Sulfurovum sp.]MCB4751597.1 type IV pilus twitching motility protein PilT [Sulfurovum sp.]MCB4754208.1 type IV pilus twitching motility protein PilT [Sulfurovum sp.]MCB4758356.1 type IV pilus twitching motility protein PilT [Sulfurovum sp.]MCB4761246.1 type IV pilus twitching motility protein PilT [Sulfurovum sp.]